MKLQILDITTTKFNTTLFNATAHIEGEPYWVRPLRPHLEEIGVDIVIAPFDKIDKSKNWFISLAPLSWNWNDYNDSLLSDFTEEIQHELMYGNAHLIINHECESYTVSFIARIYESLKKSPIDPNKIIYMVAAPDVHSTYERFVSDHRLLNHQKIQLMSTCHVYKNFSYPLSVFDYNRTAKKEKKFLSLNRTGRDHRIMFVSLLAYYDLIDYGYVSMGIHQEDVENTRRELHQTVNLDKEVLLGFDLIRDKLPLKIDDVDLRENQFKVNSLPTSFYEKSYFSVVSSTFALSYKEPSVGFTEKELKPILYKHPFIIHNLPGVLKHLKLMGFMTFSKWFDESYDDEKDDYKRLNKIVQEVARLSKISDLEWDKMLREMEPILLHNYNRLTKYNSEHSFFNSDLKNFLYYVGQ